jgi:hypothetical protein
MRTEEDDEEEGDSSHGVNEVNVQAFSYDFCSIHGIGSLELC